MSVVEISQAYSLLREAANQWARSVHRSGHSYGRMACSVPRVEGDDAVLLYEHIPGSGRDDACDVRDDFVATSNRLGYRTWAWYHVTAKVEVPLDRLLSNPEDIDTAKRGTAMLNQAVDGLLKATHAKMPQKGRSGRVGLTLVSVYDTTAIIRVAHDDDGKTSLALTHGDFLSACEELSIPARRDWGGCLEIRIPLSDLLQYL